MRGCTCEVHRLLVSGPQASTSSESYIHSFVHHIQNSFSCVYYYISPIRNQPLVSQRVVTLLYLRCALFYNFFAEIHGTYSYTPIPNGQIRGVVSLRQNTLGDLTFAFREKAIKQICVLAVQRVIRPFFARISYFKSDQQHEINRFEQIQYFWPDLNPDPQAQRTDVELSTPQTHTEYLYTKFYFIYTHTYICMCVPYIRAHAISSTWHHVHSLVHSNYLLRLLDSAIYP